MTTTKTARTQITNVISVCGGKVHYGHGELLSWAFPICRTGAMTNSGTKYRETTLEVTCTNCLARTPVRAAAPTFDETVTALTADYCDAETDRQVDHASRNAVFDRLFAASRTVGLSDEDAADRLFDEVFAPATR